MARADVKQNNVLQWEVMQQIRRTRAAEDHKQ